MDEKELLSHLPLRKFLCQICKKRIEFAPEKTFEDVKKHYIDEHGVDEQTAMWWAGKVELCAKIMKVPDMQWEMNNNFVHCSDTDHVGVIETKEIVKKGEAPPINYNPDTASSLRQQEMGQGQNSIFGARQAQQQPLTKGQQMDNAMTKDEVLAMIKRDRGIPQRQGTRTEDSFQEDCAYNTEDFIKVKDVIFEDKEE